MKSHESAATILLPLWITPLGSSLRTTFFIVPYYPIYTVICPNILMFKNLLFWTPGSPEGVLSNCPCLSSRPFVVRL